MKQWKIALIAAVSAVAMTGLLLIAAVVAVRIQVSQEVRLVTDRVGKEVSDIREIADLAIAFLDKESEVPVSDISVKTTGATVMELSLYDEDGNLLERTESLLPAYLMNMEREQLKDFFDEIYGGYEEYYGGYEVTSAEMTSFSAERVCVSKVCETADHGFFIHVLNDSIVVYYSDRETIFDATGISISELSAEEQIRLRRGVYVETQEEVFSLLEAFTS